VGAWLRKHTSATELMVSPWGLPSYEYGGPVYDPTLLNSEKDLERYRSARYYVREVLDGTPRGRDLGGEMVALFRCSQTAVGYALYARRDSEIVRSGFVHLARPQPGQKLSRLSSKDLKASSRRMANRLDGVELAGLKDAFPGCMDVRETAVQ
jgi:hypothetical protein